MISVKRIGNDGLSGSCVSSFVLLCQGCQSLRLFFFFSNGHRFSAHYFHSHITDDISRVRFYFERLAAHVRLRGRARSEALQDPPPIFFQANDQGKGVKEELLIGIDYYLHWPRC